MSGSGNIELRWGAEQHRGPAWFYGWAILSRLALDISGRRNQPSLRDPLLSLHHEGPNATGADTLLLLYIDGSTHGAYRLYTAPGGEASATAMTISVTPIPEPNTFLIFGSGMVVIQ